MCRPLSLAAKRRNKSAQGNALGPIASRNNMQNGSAILPTASRSDIYRVTIPPGRCPGLICHATSWRSLLCKQQGSEQPFAPSCESLAFEPTAFQPLVFQAAGLSVFPIFLPKFSYHGLHLFPHSSSLLPVCHASPLAFLLSGFRFQVSGFSLQSHRLARSVP